MAMAFRSSLYAPLLRVKAPPG
eukprot:gene10249-biopygen9318